MISLCKISYKHSILQYASSWGRLNADNKCCFTLSKESRIEDLALSLTRNRDRYSNSGL
eukprot:gene5339-15501_t